MTAMKSRPFTLAVYLLLATFFLNACTASKQKESANQNEHLVMATLYLQTAAEARALRYQAFNLATLRLDNALAHLKKGKKPAVILDIDETILDNSPYEAYLIKHNLSFPAGWKAWLEKAEARALSGAKAFLDHANQKGVDIFYVSNRRIQYLQSTMENLRKVNFPQVNKNHIYLRENTSSKEARRQTIAKTHQILLLLGDNLNDFAQVFEKKSVEERFAATDSLREKFGRKFIVLPNPMYGEWEGALYNYHWQMSAAQKDSARKAALRAFIPAN